ncbi:MAG: hypothetical protein JWO89_2646 [Verrucomicrobiaceae bacterium]|nr:hypothetical protein [Verrucomicrobiaceae bacterium]
MKRFFLCLLLATGAASAHDPGISNVTIELGSSPITIRFSFAPADLLVAGMEGTDQASLADQAAKVCEWRTPGGPAPLHVQSARMLDAGTVEFALDVPRVPGELHSLLLPAMPNGHRQLLVMRDHAGESYRIQMLNARSAGERVSHVDLERTAAPLQHIEPHGAHLSSVWMVSGGLVLTCVGACALLKRSGLSFAG